MPREDEEDELSDEGGLEGDEEEENKAYRMHCRMYENQFPEIDDVVMVQVRSIAEMGAYVSLLEYNNIEGMILLSELSRRRIRSINKLIRVGKQEVCMVLRVDREKGYIDLSKRRVSPEDVQKCDERFQRSKAVHSILRHVSEVQSVDMEELYRQTAWPLYEKFGHAYEAFRAAITDPESIFNEELMPGLNPDLKTAMLANIKTRLTPTAVKVRCAVSGARASSLCGCVCVRPIKRSLRTRLRETRNPTYALCPGGSLSPPYSLVAVRRRRPPHARVRHAAERPRLLLRTLPLTHLLTSLPPLPSSDPRRH